MIDWLLAVYASIPWGAIVVLLVYLIKNPDKAEKWGALIAKSLSFVNARFERSAVARDIESDINSFARNANGSKENGIFPYYAKIKWVTQTSREAFIQNNKMVIRMQHHDNQARNFLYATMDWINNGTIPESRGIIHPSVYKALEFSLINKILIEKKRYDSKQLFVDEFYEKEAPENSLIRYYTTAFNALDSKGLLMGVVLPEYASFAKVIDETVPTKTLISESIGFANMLDKLARKKQGIDVSPNYKGDHISCSIALVAKTEKYNVEGIRPYINYINKCCGEGFKSIYVCATGENNFSIVNRIKDSYEKSKTLSLVSETTRRFSNSVSIVLHYNVNSLNKSENK